MNQLDIDAPDVLDPHPIPDHTILSNKLKVCIQESEVEQNSIIPADSLKLIDNSIRSLDLGMWAGCIR